MRARHRRRLAVAGVSQRRGIVQSRAGSLQDLEALNPDEREIWLMGGDGEDQHRIVGSDAQASRYHSITWSPTGKRVAFIRSQGVFAKREVTIETCDLSGSAELAAHQMAL
jgi:Tol biopolymer transport system component